MNYVCIVIVYQHTTMTKTTLHVMNQMGPQEEIHLKIPCRQTRLHIQTGGSIQATKSLNRF
jgi:hypothetical protein